MVSASASGRQYELAHGAYRASVASVGASLRALSWRGRDLIRSYGADEMRPRYRGAVLAPWPNRVPDGRWTWRGRVQQLDITEPEHASALHGLTCWLDWQARQVSADAVELRTRLWPQPGYPFLLDLAMRWALTERGLGATLTATNAGDGPAPYGCGIHPYLVAGSGGLVDGWTLHVPASERLEVDDRLRVVRLQSPPPEADFGSARTIGATAVDHAYSGVAFRDGRAEVVLTDARGDGVSMGFGESTPWVQVHTSDRPDEPAHHRRGVAVEPMTCPPEAFVTGQDLLVLEPGQSITVPWSLAGV